jgi:hypothetical protein
MKDKKQKMMKERKQNEQDAGTRWRISTVRSSIAVANRTQVPQNIYDRQLLHE